LRKQKQKLNRNVFYKKEDPLGGGRERFVNKIHSDKQHQQRQQTKEQ